VGNCDRSDLCGRPTLAAFFVFWRTLGDLGQAALPGIVVLIIGAVIGAVLHTLIDRSNEDTS
jgi:hypothetical protein